MTLEDDFAEYYRARAPVHDEQAGYLDPEAELLREPIKERYRRFFAGRDVLEIACGTGYWTSVIAGTARSVRATDIHPEMVEQARVRCRDRGNVSFRVADAYALHGVGEGFDAALAVWWWSHVPRRRLPAFLATLHERLLPGAVVLFADELPYDRYPTRTDADGNRVELRPAPDGRVLEVVKNFPDESEVRRALAGLAEDVEFVARPEEGGWTVTYRATAFRGGPGTDAAPRG
jgi:demethylmenaquinone methyltransferase/2-methoxy-6-polyprenyl-1,4-benzoquinol methylase